MSDIQSAKQTDSQQVPKSMNHLEPLSVSPYPIVSESSFIEKLSLNASKGDISSLQTFLLAQL